jgi:hypothetical protein
MSIQHADGLTPEEASLRQSIEAERALLVIMLHLPL